MNFPSVTIAIPTFNEEFYISGVLDAFLKSKYSNIIELFVGDGMSTDKTQEIVKEYSKKDSRIKLIENKKRIQSEALNLILMVAKGDLFLRADAHCVYDEKYVEKCVEAFLKSEAYNVGGAQRFISKQLFQSGISIAVRSPLGSGGANYRDEEFSGYSETVFLGCFRTDILKKVGGYKTDQITNEDMELNFRLNKLKKNAVYISSDIKVFYYPRNSANKLFWQYFKYGKGRFLTQIKHLDSKNIRGILPFIFLVFLILITLISVSTGFYLLLFPLLFTIFILFVGEAIRINAKFYRKFNDEIWKGDKEKIPGIISRIIATFTSFIIMIFAHSFGFGFQMIKYIFGKKTW